MILFLRHPNLRAYLIRSVPGEVDAVSYRHDLTPLELLGGSDEPEPE